MPRPPQPPWVLDARRRLGDRIRDARNYANLTQQTVYERAGVDRTTYQRFEAGVSDPRYGDLLQVARAIGVPLAELVAE